jgi:hypothetical protein
MPAGRGEPAGALQGLLLLAQQGLFSKEQHWVFSRIFPGGLEGSWSECQIEQPGWTAKGKVWQGKAEVFYQKCTVVRIASLVNHGAFYLVCDLESGLYLHLKCILYTFEHPSDLLFRLFVEIQ